MEGQSGNSRRQTGGTHNWRKLCRLIVLALVISSQIFHGPATQAQLLETIYSFGNVNGSVPWARLTLGPDGNYYGTTSGGGTYYCGTVYCLTTNGTINTIASFNATNGANPRAGLTLGADGCFYGTTFNGGSSNAQFSAGMGTVFRVTANGTITTLARFNLSNGANPAASLLPGNDGAFYGTTAHGGITNSSAPDGAGTVFRITTNGLFATLAIITNGDYPSGSLIQLPDSSLYGTTSSGGSGGWYGTVFRVTTNGQFTTATTFSNSPIRGPTGLTLAGDGLMYGTDSSGNIFTVTTNGIVATLAKLSLSDLSAPLVMGTNGHFYGTFYKGVFSVTTNGAITYYTNGLYSRDSLTAIGDGSFLGTTPSGGTYNAGTVFQFYPDGTTNTIASFDGINGVNPNTTLTLGADGSLYGTTRNGGVGAGTVFRVSTNGAENTLTCFNDLYDGVNPNTSVVFGGDGSLYGTTATGGKPVNDPCNTQSQGTVFKITTDGSLKTIACFNTPSNGALPQASLTLGRDGYLYGSTRFSGIQCVTLWGYDSYAGYGLIYRMDTNGNIGPVAPVDGDYSRYPSAALTLANDGNYYGVAEGSAYAGGFGAVFRFSTNMTMSTVATFGFTNGAAAATPLTLAQDGSLFGNTYGGGISNASYPFGMGVLYSVTTNGGFRLLRQFNVTNNGANPSGPLLQGSDNWFYGTTSYGGNGSPTNGNGLGTIFRADKYGALNVLASFNITNGSYPDGGLTLGPDGCFYGATYRGGAANNGTIFRFTVPPAILQQPSSSTNLPGDTVNITVTVACPNPFGYQWQMNGTNLVNGAKFNGVNSNVLTIANISSNDVGYYCAVVSNRAGMVVTANAITAVSYTPLISSPPQGLAGPTGGSVTFNVAAAGAFDFTYQWMFDGANIPGATNPALVLVNLALTNAGSYSAVLSDAYGSVTSSPALLTVAYISQQPVSVVVTNGGSAEFNVAVAGNGSLNYQWQFNGTNLPPLISTIAGYAFWSGVVSNGIAATNALINEPSGIAVDAFGNIYFCDTLNQIVRKIDTNGIIFTVAGTAGIPGSSGNGRMATNAYLHTPYAIAVDSIGNLFIADSLNSRIQKVATNGTVTTVAGTGVPGYAGDGNLATLAKMSYPYCIAVDSSGNLYISDSTNNCLRKVDINGIITTIAGSGQPGYSGDGGYATNALLNFPTGVAVDGIGNIFFADCGNGCIRKISTAGVISTVAGNGTNGYSGDGGPASKAKLYCPGSVALDSFGNIIISDTGDNAIRLVNTNGIISTIAGGRGDGYSGDNWLAINAQLGLSLTTLGFPSDQELPSGVAVDQAGNYIITDPRNDCVRKISPANSSSLVLNDVSAKCIGYFSAVVCGCITSSVAMLNMPAFVVAPPQDNVVLGGGSAFFTVLPGSTGPFTFQWLFNGTNISGATNSTFVVQNAGPNDAGLYSVAITNLYGGTLSSPATLAVAYISQQPVGQSIPLGGLASFSVLMTAAGQFRYAWQFDGTNLPASGTIATLAGNGTNSYSGDGGTAISACLSNPHRMAMDLSGNLFIADSGNNCIRKVDTNGIIWTVAGNGTGGYSGDGGLATNAACSNPCGISVDRFSNLYIADTYNNRIRKVDRNGIITTVAGNGLAGFSGDGGPATNASFFFPNSVACDQNGNLYIADTPNDRIRKVDVGGNISTIAGNGSVSPLGDGGLATNASLYYPSGVALDQNGNLYIADTDDERVRKVDTNGIITTVAGNGLTGVSGDGASATNTPLDQPQDVVVNNSGNVFFADNYKIREVLANGIITTIAGTNTIGYSGDGGLATTATLNDPYGLAVDRAGDVFISDTYNQRVRIVTGVPPFPPTLSTFLLDNAAGANAGLYSVVVADTNGNVLVSSPASLSVYLPVRALITMPTVKAAEINFAGLTNFSYVLQSSTNLASMNSWVPIFTNPSDANGVWSFTISNLPANQPEYFRIATP